jgi:hypothetical protein
MSELADRLLTRTKLRPDAAERLAARLERHPDLKRETERWLDDQEFDLTLQADGRSFGQLLAQFSDMASALAIAMDLREDPIGTRAFLARGWDRIQG